MINMNFFFGIVEQNSDAGVAPGKLCRVQVRIFGIHSADKIKSDKEGIPTEELIWAIVGQGTDSAAMNGIGKTPRLLKGTQVYGFFRDLHNQAPVIIGTIPGIPEASPDPSKGFNDPDGIYPKADYLNESDINRLARNENIDQTIVQDKINSRVTAVPTAAGSTWDEPANPYAAVYPNNQVTESESGHIYEIDDTPGHERLHEYHKSGTFKEVHPNGDEVVKVVGKNYVLIASDNNVRIGGTCNITVIGTANLKATLAKVQIPSTEWTGDIVHNGNMNHVGDTVHTGNTVQTGDQVSSGTITGSTDVIAGGISGKTHTHNYHPGPGGPTPSDPPQ